MLAGLGCRRLNRKRTCRWEGPLCTRKMGHAQGDIYSGRPHFQIIKAIVHARRDELTKFKHVFRILPVLVHLAPDAAGSCS